MEKLQVILVGQMNYNKNVSIWSIHNCYPAQMIQAQSAFFNKGNMLKPWFVSSIDNPITKRIITLVKEFAGKPVTEETANKVEEELDKVVNSKKSHAMNYRVKGYDIEGKTGTAQVADSNGGGYVKGENPYFVSFIGDAPKKNLKSLSMQV